MFLLTLDYFTRHMFSMNAFWDRLGISTSLLCVLHCLLTPLLVTVAPLLGATLSHEWFHIIIIVIVVPVALFALVNGYRIHRRSSILWLGALGFVFLIAGVTLGHDHEVMQVACMVTAGLFFSSAHFLNLKSCKLH